MNIPSSLLVHTVVVRPLLGRNSHGDIYGDEFPVRCFAEQKRRLVRNRQGDEVVTHLRLICEPGQAERFPEGSQLIYNGRTSAVVLAINHDDGGMGAPQHSEVSGT